jgi:hypothetical protein
MPRMRPLVLVGIAAGVLVVAAWLLWAWASGGFCNPPPGAACL